MGEERGRILTVANQKGGVGKTTTSINLSYSLTLFGKRVLLVDLDSQGNATSGLGVEIPEKSPITKIGKGLNLKEEIVETNFRNLFMIPGGPSLLETEKVLHTTPRAEKMLAGALEPLRDSFHYIVLDCPPSLGFMTLSALVAADYVIVPLQCEYFAMEGLGSLLQTVRRVKRYLNPSLVIMGILLTMYDGRNRLSREVEREIKRLLGEKVFKTIIPRNVRLGEAPSYGLPVHLYDRRSKGAASYIELAKEVLERDGER